MSQTETISTLDYKKTVLILNENLQQLCNFSQQLGLTEISIQSQHLSQKLANNSFNIAVFGEFNKGKSTFINALIGQEVLPADILATTATITRIIHKRYTSAKVCFKNGHEQDIPLEQLSRYITKLSETATATSATIKEAIIFYPLPFAQENYIEIIDTPGLNDDAEMTERTLSIIQNCDIAIMVISAQTPFSMSEATFLKKLLNQGITKILFIVNQIDLYTSKDAQRIIELIEKRIDKILQEWTEEQPNHQNTNNLLQVFGISALKAIQARQSKNMELLAQSHFANLELELKKIINEQLNIIRLEQVTQKIGEFSREIATQIEIKNIGLDSSQMQLKIMSDSFTERIKQIKIVKTNTAQSLNSLVSSLNTQLSALNYSFVDTLKQKAREVITSTSIDADQFNKDLEGFQQNLSSHIVSELDDYTKHLARDINQNAQKSLSSSWDILKNFSDKFQSFIEHIDSEIISLKSLDEMIAIRASNIVSFIEREYKDCGQSPPSLSLSFPGNSHTFMIDYQPSGAGALIGAGIGAFLFGPVGAGAGYTIGAGIGNARRINKFKENYEPQVIAKIETLASEMNIPYKINTYFEQAFSHLNKTQTAFLNEVDDLFTFIQTNLAEVLGKNTAIYFAQKEENQQTQNRLRVINHQIEQIAQYLQQLSD